MKKGIIAVAVAILGLMVATLATPNHSGGVQVASAASNLTINGVTCNATAFNPVKFAIQPGVSYSCTISDSDLVVNGAVNVYIQGDFDGSPQVIQGTADAATHTISFTFVATALGCGTTALTYAASADGRNGSIVNTNTGFGFVNAEGQEVICGSVTTTTVGTTTVGTTTGETTTTAPTTTTTPTTTAGTTTVFTTTTVPVTTTAPGTTVTLPGVTTTAPAQTVTNTQTVTQTVTTPGPTQTVTNTQTVTSPGATKVVKVTKTVLVKVPAKKTAQAAAAAAKKGSGPKPTLAHTE